MKSSTRNATLLLIAAVLVGGATWVERVQGAAATQTATQTATPTSAQLSAQAAAQTSAKAAAAAAALPLYPGMPPLVDPKNLYSETSAGKVSAALQGDLQRVYVPNLRSNDVYVIDPETLKVVDRFKVGVGPQHIVPSWDLRTLWVSNNAEGRTDGTLTPIDPRTGKPGPAVKVDDPYNMYYTPDGASAIVVAEARKRLDFRDAKTMALQYSIDTPGCAGVNHAEFTNNGRFAIFTCEFSGALVKIDLMSHKVAGYLQLQMPATRFQEVKSGPRAEPGQVWEPGATEICSVVMGMPQDIRSTPDGKLFYVADMQADGVHVIDPWAFKEVGFVSTGIGAHGLYPSRDGKSLYVTDRGSHEIRGPKRANGGVSVIDFASGKMVARWPVPGGGSPDMGNVSADGRWLWLSGRYDSTVYRFDTTTGEVKKIKVGTEPHGLTVWPQPGRYSLGHTGNMR